MWLDRLAKEKHYRHWHRVLLFGAWLWLFTTWSIQNTNAAQYATATAHVNPTAPDTPVADPDSQESAASQTGAKPTEAADQTDKDKPKDEKHHDGAIIVAPLPIVSAAIGAGIIPVLGYIFPFEEKDKNSPPSVVGGAGLITDNGSRGFGVGGDVFLKEDRYELRSIYAHGNINYDLYGVGYVNGNSPVKLPLKQTGQILFVEFLHNIHWKIFVGPRFVNGNSFITVNTTNGPASKIPPDVGLTTNLRAVGFREQYENQQHESQNSIPGSPA